MRVLVTGSRNWTDRAAVYAALDEVYGAWVNRDEGIFVVVHGGARGADTLAHDWAQAISRADDRVFRECHPADWDSHHKRAGHIRNAEMISLGADICLAFPLGESRGTRGCMRLARKAGIQVKDCSYAQQ